MEILSDFNVVTVRKNMSSILALNAKSTKKPNRTKFIIKCFSTILNQEGKQMYEKWVKERGRDWYSPIEVENQTYEIVTGLAIIGIPDGDIIGEFWFEEDGNVGLKFYGSN
jgi:hypothetical protein